MTCTVAITVHIIMVDGGIGDACAHIQLNIKYTGFSVCLSGEFLTAPFVEMKIKPQNCNLD